MYKQERLQQPVQGELVSVEAARALGRATVAVIGGVRRVFAAIAEPFGGPQQLDLLDPKVRAGMTAKDKGTVDAYFHGV